MLDTYENVKFQEGLYLEAVFQLWRRGTLMGLAPKLLASCRLSFYRYRR